MKKSLLLVLAIFICSSVRAQLLTFDVANLQQSIAQYSALIQQISQQATQISNQVNQIRQLDAQITNQFRQITQIDTHLTRLGDMASIRNLVGLVQLKLDLSLPTKLEGWADTLEIVDGLKILEDSREGLFKPITPTFEDFDGATVDRDGDRYKPAHAVTAKVDNFVEVQKDILTRRAQLKEAIEVTTEAVRNATTDAEEKKQEAILQAQYDQLASLDSEIGLSAAEIQVKVAEKDAMAEAKNEANAEARSHLNRRESEKVGSTFKPYYGCMLQYVKEKRFKP